VVNILKGAMVVIQNWLLNSVKKKGFTLNLAICSLLEKKMIRNVWIIVLRTRIKFGSWKISDMLAMAIMEALMNNR